MNEEEYDIIDELYFVTSFRDLAQTLTFAEDELCGYLQELLKKGYVKAFFPDPDTEVEFNERQFRDSCTQYFYLATKAGLVKHNSR